MWDRAWPSVELNNLKRQLQTVVEAVQSSSSIDQDVTRALLTRFLVVRAAGYLEAVVDECCKSLIRSKASPTVASFASSGFGSGRNPSPNKLLELVQKFSLEWREELREIFDADDEYLHRELSLMVDKRNRIAHGLSEGVGVRKALDFVACVHVIGDWFIQRFDPR